MVAYGEVLDPDCVGGFLITQKFGFPIRFINRISTLCRYHLALLPLSFQTLHPLRQLLDGAGMVGIGAYQLLSGVG